MDKRGGLGGHCTILLSRVARHLKKGVGRIWNQSIILAEVWYKRVLWAVETAVWLDHGVGQREARGVPGREGTSGGGKEDCGGGGVLGGEGLWRRGGGRIFSEARRGL